MKLSLYEQIGLESISKIIEEFYRRAFDDLIIGHFFFSHDREDLTRKQITFSAKLLGSKEIEYLGKPLRQAHSALPLRKAHFNRRQVIMSEVMDFYSLDKFLKTQWLDLEEKLRGLVVNSTGNCHR